MATLTYTDLQTRVMNRIRIPTTNTTQATIVQGIINDVYREIYAMNDWWWLEKSQVINTVNDYLTGTVAVTNGSTAVTLSAAPAGGLGSFADRVLLITGDTTDASAVYRISAHTAGSVGMTLDANFTGTTATAASYNIYQDSYDLASDVGKILRVKRYGFLWPMKEVGPSEMASLKIFDQTVGKPQWWTHEEFDTSGDPTTARQLVVHPYPDNTYRMEILYKQALNTEVTGSTRLFIPDDYAEIVVYGALAIAFPTLLSNDRRGKVFDDRYQGLLNRMILDQLGRAHDKPQIVVEDQYRAFYGYKNKGKIPRGVNLGSWFDRWPVNP